MDDRRGNTVQPEAATAPNFLAVLDVVGADPVRAGHDDERALAVLDDQRRRPRRRLVAGHPPALLPGLLVQRDDERVAFVVPVDDDVFAGEHGRCPLAELVPRRHVTQVDLPLDVALEVEAVQAS